MEQFELSPAIPQLPSGDIYVTAEFFKDLGFEIVSLMKEYNFLIVRRGPVELHFWQTEDVRTAMNIGEQSSCYVRVKNISALFEEFKNRKIVFRYELKKMPWGMYEMQIDDPFGNAIKFGEMIN